MYMCLTVPGIGRLIVLGTGHLIDSACMSASTPPLKVSVRHGVRAQESRKHPGLLYIYIFILLCWFLLVTIAHVQINLYGS